MGTRDAFALVEQSRIASGLSQSQQRFEHMDFGPTHTDLVHLVADLGPTVIA